eukprot:scpid52632/ scgid8296/ 
MGSSPERPDNHLNIASYQVNGAVMPLELTAPALNKDGEHEEDEATPSLVEAYDYRRVLSFVPSPKSHHCVRYCFALAAGTGIKFRSIFPLSIFLLVLMLFGFAGWIYVAVWSCAQTLNNAQDKQWTKTTTAYILLWLAKGCAELAYLWSFLCSVIYAHHVRYNYSPFRSSFCASSLRLNAGGCNVGSRLYRSTFGGRVHSFLPDAIALSSIIFSAALAWDYTCRLYLTSTYFPPGSFWNILFHTYQVWLLFAGVSGISLFTVLCDDTVFVIHSNQQKLMHGIALKAAAVENGGDASGCCCQNAITNPRAIIEHMLTLQRYVEVSMKAPMRWLVGNTVLCVLGMLMDVAGQIMYLLSGDKQAEGGDSAFVLLMLLGIVATFFVPMYCASRVTNAIERLRANLQANIHLARRLSAADHSYLLLFLQSYRCGLHVFGARVSHRQSVQLMALILTVASLRRSL